MLLLLTSLARAADPADDLYAQLVARRGADPENAIVLATTLVKTYPESAHVPAAYLWLGDYYFERNNAYKALVAYQRAATFPKAVGYARAVHQLGWCYFNVGEFSKAISELQRAVAVTDDTSEPRREAVLTDLADMYADAGDVTGAEATFHGRPDLLVRSMERLAATNARMGKYEEARAAWARLLALDPSNPRAGEWRAALVAAEARLR